MLGLTTSGRISLPLFFAEVKAQPSVDMYKDYVAAVTPIVAEYNKPMLEQKIGGVPLPLVFIGGGVAVWLLMEVL